jgi:hypothetical protein
LAISIGSGWNFLRESGYKTSRASQAVNLLAQIAIVLGG